MNRTGVVRARPPFSAEEDAAGELVEPGHAVPLLECPFSEDAVVFGEPDPIGGPLEVQDLEEAVLVVPGPRVERVKHLDELALTPEGRRVVEPVGHFVRQHWEHAESRGRVLLFEGEFEKVRGDLVQGDRLAGVGVGAEIGHGVVGEDVRIVSHEILGRRACCRPLPERPSLLK